MSLVIKFKCKSCYTKEIERVKASDKVANQGKKFYDDKLHSELDTNNYVRTASEVQLLSDLPNQYGAESDVAENKIQGWSCTCSVCGSVTTNWLSVNVGDLL